MSAMASTPSVVRLHPRHRRPVVPVLLGVLAVVLGRLDAHDELRSGRGERLGEVDRGLDVAVGLVVDGDRLVHHLRPLRFARIGVGPRPLEVAAERRQIGGGDRPRLDVHVVVVDGLDRHGRSCRHRVGRDPVALQPVQRRLGRADVERHLGVLAQRLAEHVAQRSVERHPVRRASGRRAADLDHVAVDVDAHAGDLRVDRHEPGVERLRVEGVAELDRERHAGHAFGGVRTTGC